MSDTPILQAAGITKVYPGGVVANDEVNLTVWPGTLHAVIGENGAGKSTLVNAIYGRIQPDSGRLRLHDREVIFRSPLDAIRSGIGLVSQHTSFIPALTVTENLLLGDPNQPKNLSPARIRSEVEALAEQFGMASALQWDTEAGRLSAAALQKVEIIKTLHRKAEILLLDEPTAMLSPQEAKNLFAMLHELTRRGSTVVFITHRLADVMAHSSRVTVLRAGKSVGERVTSETYPDDLLSLMIGHKTTMAGLSLGGESRANQPPSAEAAWERGARSEMTPETLVHQDAQELPLLELRDLDVRGRRGLAVRGASLSVKAGEIVGVAGVDGSGQRELAEAVAGVRLPVRGEIWLQGKQITSTRVGERLKQGIAYVPEDRQRDGLVMEFTLSENLLLGRQRDSYFGGGRTLDTPRMAARGETAIKRHQIRAPGPEAPVFALSGGNQQKVLLARALDGDPQVLVLMQPTRGLDVKATRAVYSAVKDAAARGVGVLWFSLDLDELMEVSDRIAVMASGTITGTGASSSLSLEQIGRWMVGQP